METTTVKKTKLEINKNMSIRAIRIFYIAGIPFSLLIAWMVASFSSQSFADLFLIEQPLFWQLPIGASIGSAIAFATGIVILKAPGIQGLRSIISEAYIHFNPKWYDLFFTALTAGIAEEILFRALLQPWAGIVLTSIIFALGHMPTPNTKGKLLMVLWIFVLGYILGILFEEFGIYCAIMAHFTIDLFLLFLYKVYLQPEPS